MRGQSEERTFERRIERRRRRREAALGSEANDSMLSLGPLMDVVTIILVYFIFNFSVSPISVQDPAINLPSSTSQEKVKEAVVVVISGDERRVVEENQVGLKPNIPTIFVDKEPLLKLDAASYRVPENLKSRGYVIAPLLEKLTSLKLKQIETSKLTFGPKFDGTVAIVADEKTPYRVLTDVLVTCGEAGFDKYKFTIAKGRKS